MPSRNSYALVLDESGPWGERMRNQYLKRLMLEDIGALVVRLGEIDI